MFSGFSRNTENEITYTGSHMFKCLIFVTEEYEIYMKKQEATFKTEVTAMVEEPRVGDVPPVVVMTKEQITTTIISGQVRASLTGLLGGARS